MVVFKSDLIFLHPNLFILKKQNMSTIETNGWDTIYVVPFSLINNSIVNKASSPSAFNQQEETDDGTVTFAGNFGHWEMATGGDGQLVMMSLPIPSATYDVGSIHRTYTNGHALIQLNLKWINDPDNPIYQILVINNDNNTVNVTDITFNENIPMSEKGNMILMLHNWLAENVADFQFIFSSVNINDSADKESFSWLMPHIIAYAVKDADPPDINTSVFGVLCTTDNRPDPGNPQVPANGLTSGANSAFLISPFRVIDKMFLPNIHTIFKDASIADFEVGNTNKYIQNINTLHFEPQTAEDGSIINLSIDPLNFRLEIQDSRIIMSFTKIYFQYSSGITVNFNHNSVAIFNIRDNTFYLTVTGSTTDISVEKSEIRERNEIIGEFVAALIAAILGGILEAAFTGGTAAATARATNAVVNEGTVNGIEMTVRSAGSTNTAPITNLAPEVAEQMVAGPARTFSNFFAQHWVKIVSIVGGAIVGDLTAKGMIQRTQNLAKGDVPPMTEFGSNSLQSIQWPGTTNENFQIVDGTLNGALQIGINLNTSGT